MGTKFSALIIAFCLSALRVFGQETVSPPSDGILTHGYRAFIDLEEFGGAGICFSTSHGYQFNPQFFAGAGISGFGLIGGFGAAIHADLRYDNLLEQKNTPFLSLRLCFINDGVAFHPSVGYRFGHFNVNVGYWHMDDDGFVSFGLGLDFGGRRKGK